MTRVPLKNNIYCEENDRAAQGRTGGSSLDGDGLPGGSKLQPALEDTSNLGTGDKVFQEAGVRLRRSCREGQCGLVQDRSCLSSIHIPHAFAHLLRLKLNYFVEN